MAAFPNRNSLALYIPLAILGSFILSYFAIGREMQSIIIGLAAIFLFIICFFSVKISLVLLIFAMLLSPELEVGHTAKREITLRAEDLLLMVMTIGWLFRMAMYKEMSFTRKNVLNWPIVIYCFIALLSTGLGIMRGNVEPASGILFTVKIIEYFFLFVVVINYIKEEQDIDMLITSILVVAAIICVYALIFGVVGGASEMQAPFEGKVAERNTLAGYLVFAAALGGGILLNSPSKFEKASIGIFIPLVLVVLLFSISRSGWIAAIVATLVLFLNSRKKGYFLIFIMITVALLPFVFPSVARDRVDFTFHQISQNDALNPQFAIFGITLDTSSSARIYSVLYVFKRFLEHPFIGFGITGFPFVDGQFTRTLAELGVFGLSTFIWIMIGVHRTIRAVMKIDISPRINGLAIGFYAGFWAMIAHAFSANTFIIVRIAEPFWCLAGIMVVSIAKYQEKQQQPAPQAVAPPPPKRMPLLQGRTI
jgi:general stress protein CsbA